jgi:hypothetical protein
MALSFLVALRRMEPGDPDEVRNAAFEPPGDAPEPATSPIA